jgi:hypothetical protein
VLIVVVVLGALAAAAYYFSSTISSATGGSNPILSVEGTSSGLNLSQGTGTIYITVKNIGSGQLFLYNLTISGKVPFTVGVLSNGTVTLTWNPSHSIHGTWRASTGTAGVVGSQILVPGGESVTMTFVFTSSDKFTDIIDVGATYSGIALPTTGRPIAFHFSMPA